MNDNIAKSICSLGVWGATAAILIWSDFGIRQMAVPIYIVLLFAAGFSTAAIWNYKISKILRSRNNEMANPANDKMEDA
jgi:hypothetical protein